MSKRQRNELDERISLKKAGWDMHQRDSVAFNGPTGETDGHIIAKTLAAQILREKGYRVDSEVEHEPTGNIADIIGYGCDGRKPIVVEFESEYRTELAKKNLSKYQHGPIADVHTLKPPCDHMRITEAKGLIETELFA